MTELPVIRCDEWSEAQVKAFRLLVNRSVTWAEWDEELVTLELEELKAVQHAWRNSSRRGPGAGNIDLIELGKLCSLHAEVMSLGRARSDLAAPSTDEAAGSRQWWSEGKDCYK